MAERARIGDVKRAVGSNMVRLTSKGGRMAGAGERWIKFLRQYGPISRNDNMFDEHIRRSADRLGVHPITFDHPLEEEVVGLFRPDAVGPRSIVLTGTAGDGKSHLCGRVWETLGGDTEVWASDEIYFQLSVTIGGQDVTLHIVRDLTALPDRDLTGRYSSKAVLLEQLSQSLFGPEVDHVFLLAANDGQLIETWRKTCIGPSGTRASALFEARLMEDKDPEPATRLAFFNLSTVSSATVFGLSLEALVAHEGWQACYIEAEEDGFFGPRCPIRKNFELLKTALVQRRLGALFELCDYNELHTPIRRVLMLLANAALGHPDARDRLLMPRDVRGLITNGTTHNASLYSNLFGANLGPTKREALEIFDYLGRFGIGQETTNRIDNILIFGAEDEHLRDYYDSLIGADDFYGGTDRYCAAQHAYVETPEETVDDQHVFLDMLVEQRRGLFFKIPNDLADELELWNLTVFAGAGEYLEEVAKPLFNGSRVSRRIVARLVNGLNRIFTGMLVATDHELLLATSLSFSSARVSEILEDRISVSPRGRQEKVDVTLRRNLPSLDVHMPSGSFQSLRLNLTRYEFLMRVSDGALPGNFSRECYEDILAFKSALLASAVQSRAVVGEETEDPSEITFRRLSLDVSGKPVDEIIEVACD